MYATHKDSNPINIQIYQTELLYYDILVPWILCRMYLHGPKFRLNLIGQSFRSVDYDITDICDVNKKIF